MSKSSILEDMLGLNEFEIDDFTQDLNSMRFHLHVKEKPEYCPKCGSYEPVLIIQKTRTQNVRDLNVLGKCVTLAIKRRYFRCSECGGMFAEPISCVEGQGRLTTRLRRHIAVRARYTSFVDIENEYQISDTTIRKAFLYDVRNLPTITERPTPSVLGIDEICLNRDDYGRKQAWAVIANGDENNVMELLASRSKATIVSTLQALRDPHKVDVVTMDMWAAYRTAVQEVLPNAMVVIDKFHVVRMANDALDSIRREITRSGPGALKKNRAAFLMREDRLSERKLAVRDEWFDAYPQLHIAYELKEAFFRLYDCPDRETALQYYDDWERSIPKDLPGFKAICRTVKRSHDEIFNYFDAPYTNAFVEGLNRSIRSLADQGCGYDFEVLRGKVLFTVGRKKNGQIYVP